MGTGSYAALRTALQQANSLDPDKLANVLSNGMKYSAPLGDGEMVSRPDLGNNRTVDSACTTYIKTIKNGQPVLVDTVPLDEGLQYVKLAFPVK